MPARGQAIAVLDVADASGVLEELRALGADAAAVRVDLTDHDAVQAGVAEVEAAVGPADILVNNAGIHPNVLLADMSIAQWQQMLTINVQSMFSTIQAYSPGMKSRRHGRIINMTSNSVHLEP